MKWMLGLSEQLAMFRYGIWQKWREESEMENDIVRPCPRYERLVCILQKTNIVYKLRISEYSNYFHMCLDSSCMFLIRTSVETKVDCLLEMKSKIFEVFSNMIT